MISIAAVSALLVTQSTSVLEIDPLLLVQAAEVWSVLGRDTNSVWPGWDPRKTPILIYFPDKQEVLINHPKPPAGFLPYTGKVRSPIGKIYLWNGKTTFSLDGQNTTMKIGGIRTLVVADTMSTRRQMIESVAAEVVAQPAKAPKLIADNLFGSPINSMAVFAHEAFHVYQERLAPKKSANEGALVRYPSLSVPNNVWLGIEADELAEALNASSAAKARESGIRWLAARQARRSQLSNEQSQYEDAVEFSEGTAKYVEYRLLQQMMSHSPSAEMWLIQGFQGYGSQAEAARNSLIRKMRGFMSGSIGVNGDLYGASPVRFRMYYSGMAIGALLDRLGAKWHSKLLTSEESLTTLAAAVLRPSDRELAEAQAALEKTERYAALLREKEQLQADGRRHIDSELSRFTEAPGELILDYSALPSVMPGLSYTPFGVLSIDANRTLYRLIPIQGTIGALKFSEDSARPILLDTLNRRIHLQLTGSPESVKPGPIQEPEVRWPGVTLNDVKGEVSIEGKRVIIRLN